jgi:hypothetical protein
LRTGTFIKAAVAAAEEATKKVVAATMSHILKAANAATPRSLRANKAAVAARTKRVLPYSVSF